MHGLMVNIDSAIDIKAYEYAPYALVSRDFWLGHIYPVAISNPKWASLSEEDKAAITRAADKSYAELGKIMDENYAQILKTAQEKGVTLRELSATEVAAWAKASDYRAVLDGAGKTERLSVALTQPATTPAPIVSVAVVNPLRGACGADGRIVSTPAIRLPRAGSPH